MTSRKLKARDKPTENGKVKRFLENNLKPTLFEGVVDTFRDRRESGRSRTWAFGAAVLKTLKNSPLWLVRTTAAFGVYSGLNHLYGARSWDTRAELSATRMIDDSGPVARWVVVKASTVAAIGSVAPEKMATVANAMMAAEFIICAIRMAAEQIAWRKTKFSGEPAGTGATPMLAFLGEATFKAIEKKPADPLTKFAIATIGMWGNFVRIVHASLIIAFGNPVWNAVTGTKPPPFESTPGRNPNTGFPEIPTDLLRSNGDLKNSNKPEPPKAA